VGAAVREAFGQEAAVTLADASCDRTPFVGRVDAAVPEPGSRTDGPVRFVLYGEGESGRTRVGRLTAVVRVTAPHVRTLLSLATRAPLDSTTVVARTGHIGRVLFGALVTVNDLASARLRRPLLADAVVTRTVVERPALVRSGGDVVTVARVQGVEVRGRAIAAQNGDLGDVVIVVNTDSRKRLRGRVVADAVVEVLDVS
jgi:flagella basal body P-ring formation protein FlgA